MAHKTPTLANWSLVPGYAKALEAFLESPTGKQLMATLKHEFRAKPLNLPIQPGVDYLQINALTNRDREAWTQIIDTIEAMSVAKEPKPRIPDAGWATEPLRREEEKEEPQSPRKKK